MSHTYTVQRGDNLWKIARENNVSHQDLIRANPHLSNPNLIQPGQRLQLPGDHFERTNSNHNPLLHSPNPPASGLAPDAPGTSTGSQYHRVRRGESLWKIARDHNVSLQNLTVANPQISNPSLIHPGQRIRIPRQNQPALNAPRSSVTPAAPVASNPSATGASLEQFPIGGNQFNIGYDSRWNNFDATNAHHNSDYSRRATNASHPTGHLGVDIFGPRGAPVVSPVTGVISNINRNSSVGGNTVTVRRGNHYFYHAHLDSIANGLRVGSSVSAGTSLGALGNSGSAQGTEPHLHFSIYKGPNGYRSGTINPFAHLEEALPNSSVA